MSELLCCGNCFNDRSLTHYIRTGGQKNKCAFCRSSDVFCIAPDELAHLFQPFLELYEPGTEKDGKRLWNLLRHDWLLFGSLPPEISKRLLSAILPDENIPDKYFQERESVDEQVDKWAEFKDELKHVNRYFCTNSPDQLPLELMFDYLTQHISSQASLFRARISYDATLFSINEMGKPPSEIVGNGRANPIGISYLYTASDRETAIAELRPHVGDSVCVCEFMLNTGLKLVDLRSPRETISPIDIVQRDAQLKDALDRMEYLTKLGKELSKPVIPREADLEYLSSQYLCELIKHCNYDGVIYKSSVGDGDNYAIFNDDGIEGRQVEIFRIIRNSYESVPI